MAPALPDVDSLEELARKLRVVQTKWNEHLLFVARKTSCDFSISAKDPATPISDALANAVRETKLIDWRINKLVDMAQIYRIDDKWCSVERLLSFVDKPFGTETAPTILRRAAMRLEDEAREESESLASPENQVSLRIERLIRSVGRISEAELEDPTFIYESMISSRERCRHELEKEPEDAVWALALCCACKYSADAAQDKNAEMKLERRANLWMTRLCQAAELGVSFGQRQALITEFFDYEDDDDDEDADEDEDEDENEGGAMDLDDG